MSHCPIIYFALLIIVSLIIGLAKVLGINLDDTFGNSWCKKNLEEW